MGLWARARILVLGLLISHFTIRLAFPFPEFFVDVILYNSISIGSALLLLFAPKYCDKTSKIFLAIGIAAWSLGSILSTWSEFSYLPHFTLTITSTLYLIFYPSTLIGLIRSIQKSTKFEFIGALDSSILTLGLISLGSTFLIKPVLPLLNGDLSKNFFGVLFPVADLILLSLALTLFLIQPLSRRNSLLLLGAFIFSLSDFLFLWLSLQENYSLGRLSDDLWLLGIVLLSEAYWHHDSSPTPTHSLHPLFITSSVMVTATLIGILLLRPGYLPAFILFPSITTGVLALARMAIALRDTRTIGEERFMARADELTGLPNRRRFIAELNLMITSSKNEDALLLLDLDGFKPINDQYGHQIGDELLKQVSARFERALPAGALLARLGGDEFGVLVRGDLEATYEAALALRATLSYPFSINNMEISVGVSVGHVRNDGGADLLHRADLAMYQAKREKIGVWSESLRN